MTHARPGIIVSAASSLVGCLLLGACGSSGPPTHATTTHSGGGETSGSAGAPASTTAAAVAATSSPAHTSAASSAGADIGACSLITEQDATTAMGDDPGRGNASGSHGATACTYGAYPRPVLTVNLLLTQGRAAYDRFRHDPKLTSGTGLPAVPVGGLGDQAFELSSLHTDAVYLTKGDTLIVIGFSAPTSPPRGAALILAKIAAGRL
jgi:hypothetical protein